MGAHQRVVRYLRRVIDDTSGRGASSRINPEYEEMGPLWSLEDKPLSQAKGLTFEIRDVRLLCRPICRLRMLRVVVWDALVVVVIVEEKVVLQLTRLIYIYYKSFIWRPFKTIYSGALPAQPRSNCIVLRPERDREEWPIGVKRNVTGRPKFQALGRATKKARRCWRTVHVYERDVLLPAVQRATRHDAE